MEFVGSSMVKSDVIKQNELKFQNTDFKIYIKANSFFVSDCFCNPLAVQTFGTN